ncbi:putative F-box protein At1g53360 [Capsella rubella]|uniref:putative F-box protein At1g53360 n=1 Tax=Capsella rubella TaxID=81985 RepID=UPI000CD52CEB|nr:putative F-box protein At1g53360 [Capsella rubella]
MRIQENHREQQFSITQSSNSVREYSDPIPVDVLIDIFSRVSATSLARFRCVSKLWESIICSHDFTELFLTKSLARPRLLFIFEANKELCVFSSPQPQNPHEISTLIATPYKCFPKYLSYESTHDISAKVLCGLVLLHDWKIKARVICNLATGESITLPTVKATGVGKNFFGFDPISKQFKVLCMTWSRFGTPNTHQILTLETGKVLLWRTIQDVVRPYDHKYGGICINGVLYYGAYFSDECFMIVCFDFKLEKFSFIELDRDMDPNNQELTLFNYKGKLGAHQYIESICKKNLKLWVLEDGEKHIWSKRICILPSALYNKKFVGMTSTGEVVFSHFMCVKSNPFCIFFYNIERQAYKRVLIKGFEEFEDEFTSVHTILDFVENMKLI